jgi:ankyrin repeat protein
VFVFVCNSIEAWLAMVVEFLGETPLIHAARQGRLQTAEYLLGHGADPSIASNMGATALHHAAGIGKGVVMLIDLYLLLFFHIDEGKKNLNENWSCHLLMQDT